MTETSSPETGRARRTRVRRGYSRKGCARCKQQRVRCDEQQPQCGRCVRAGADCPGYEQTIRWSAKHEVFWQPPARQRQQTTQTQTQRQMQTQTQTQHTPPMALPLVPPVVGDTYDALAPPAALFDSGPAGADNGPWTDLLDPLFAPLVPGSPSLAIYQPDGPSSGPSVCLAGPLLEAPVTPMPWALSASADNNNNDDDDVECIERADYAPPASPASRALGLPSSASMAGTHAWAPPLAASLTDMGTVLVEFYFKVTAQIYSCYDGQRNPFRTAVTRLWDSSRILYCTLQSMAAASLVRDFPGVAPLGRQLRREAEALVAQAAVWDNRTVLAVLMLGGSAGWHDCRDLGLAHFHRMAAHLAATAAGGGAGSGSGSGNIDDGDDDGSDAVAVVSPRHRNGRFLRESMLFWGMNMAFVTDSATYAAFPPYDGQQRQQQRWPDPPPPLPPPLLPPLEPHPWTGFGAETMRAMLHVGQLVRRQRRAVRARARQGLAADGAQAQRDLAAAAALEAWLVRMQLPDEAAVGDTGDRNAPAWHLLALAGVVRDAALVQLYHVFPDLLWARARTETGTGPGTGAGADTRAWLTAFALRSLATLQTVPAESGTCDFQPFLLVTLSSELRVVRRPGPVATAAVLDMATIEVTRARGFVQGRLATFLRALPPRPMEACLAIVQETWRQMDEQAARRQQQQPGAEHEADVYWMDVMMDHGWETIMA